MYKDLNELSVGFLKYFCTFFQSSFKKINLKKILPLLLSWEVKVKIKIEVEGMAW
jgi:hypothetical protein